MMETSFRDFSSTQQGNPNNTPTQVGYDDLLSIARNHRC
jgi:hypothetical protein